MLESVKYKDDVHEPAGYAEHIYEDCAWFSGEAGEFVPVLVRVYDTGDFHIELGNYELEEFWFPNFKNVDELIDFAWDCAQERAIEEGWAYN